LLFTDVFSAATSEKEKRKKKNRKREVQTGNTYGLLLGAYLPQELKSLRKF
jgi:hypothetical protein